MFKFPWFKSRSKSPPAFGRVHSSEVYQAHGCIFPNYTHTLSCKRYDSRHVSARLRRGSRLADGLIAAERRAGNLALLERLVFASPTHVLELSYTATDGRTGSPIRIALCLSIPGRDDRVTAVEICEMLTRWIQQCRARDVLLPLSRRVAAYWIGWILSGYRLLWEDSGQPLPLAIL